MYEGPLHWSELLSGGSRSQIPPDVLTYIFLNPECIRLDLPFYPVVFRKPKWRGQFLFEEEEDRNPARPKAPRSMVCVGESLEKLHTEDAVSH